MFEDLLQMDVAELQDLLGVLTEDSHAGHGVHDPAELVSRIEQQLRLLLEVEATADRAAVERRAIGLVAEALSLELDPAASPASQLDRLYEHISARVVEELTPLFRVAVSMGWADGTLTEEELLVMSSGLRRVRLSEKHRMALTRIVESAGAVPDQTLSGIPGLEGGPDRRRALLAFAWAVALADGREDPGERALYDRLAENLGVELEEATQLRQLITTRYTETLASVREQVGDGSDLNATAALGALVASGLEAYLVSATGVIGLSMVLGVPISLSGTASLTALPRNAELEHDVGAPGLLAGSLLLAGLRKKPALQKSLAIILSCLDRRA